MARGKPRDGSKNPGGRPTEYTDAKAEHICEWLLDGVTLQKIAKRLNVRLGTIFVWREKHARFEEMYARARQMLAEKWGMEIVDLADTPNLGVRIKRKSNRRIEVIEGDNVERSKLRVEARKWAASKVMPKRYGEKPIDDAERKDKLNQLEAIFRHGPYKAEVK